MFIFLCCKYSVFLYIVRLTFFFLNTVKIDKTNPTISTDLHFMFSKYSVFLYIIKLTFFFLNIVQLDKTNLTISSALHLNLILKKRL